MAGSSGLGEAVLVPVQLRFGWRVPADLGFDDHVQLGRQELDVGEPAVGPIVLLQFDSGWLGHEDARRDPFNEPTEQGRVVRERPAERGGHVVLVVPDKVK